MECTTHLSQRRSDTSPDDDERKKEYSFVAPMSDVAGIIWFLRLKADSAWSFMCKRQPR